MDLKKRDSGLIQLILIALGKAAKGYVNNTARAHVHNALVMMNASCSIWIANATAIRFSDITWCVCFLEYDEVQTPQHLSKPLDLSEGF